MSLRKLIQILISTLLGLVLGLEVAVAMMIPGWEAPEGLAAGAIWGGIFLLCTDGVFACRLHYYGDRGNSRHESAKKDFDSH